MDLKRAKSLNEGQEFFIFDLVFKALIFPALQSKTYLMIPGEVLRLTAVLISGA